MSTTRTLTMGGKTFSRIGYGAMGLSQSYGAAKDDESKDVLRKAVEIGCTLWDTADVYGKGHNERLISEVLKEPGVRERVFLVTKFGFSLEDMSFLGGDMNYLRSAIDKSIERLGTTPDAWIIHRIPKETPIEEVVTEMDKVRKAGKVKFIGIGECSADTLRRASKVTKIDFIESEYAPFCLDLEENGVLELCKELDVKILAFSPLGKGFLTGRFRTFEDFKSDGDARGNGMFPRLAKENFERNFKIVEELEKVASKKGCKPSQLALAWILHQAEQLIPIPGTKSEKYLIENFDASKINFTEDELKSLRAIIEANQPVGDRYIPQLQATLDR